MNINISAKEIDFNKHLIVDIRTASEINDFSIDKVLLYPIDFNSADENNVLKYFKNLNQEFNKKQIVLMCHSGARSAMLCEFLNANNINTLNLTGGIMSISSLYPELVKA